MAELREITRGMEVVAIDGELIGRVTGVRGGPTSDQTASDAGDGGTGGAGGANAGDLAGDTHAPGRSGYGPIPSGVTTDKDRGTPTAAGVAAERGQVHTTLGQEGLTPGAGGQDALRGYGTAENLTGDPPGTPMTAAQIEGIRGADRPGDGGSTPADGGHGARHATGEAVILVQDQGTLGVGARGLEVPLSGVLELTPSRRLILDCTRDEAAERYGTGPSLDIDENADVTPF
jgi:hypothetical protein